MIRTTFRLIFPLLLFGLAGPDAGDTINVGAAAERNRERAGSPAIAATHSTPAPAGGAGDWPQHLGPTRNGVVPAFDLRTDWGRRPLAATWRVDVGAGFAGPAVVGGRLLLFHRVANEEVIEALSVADGASLWRTGYPTTYRDDFGFDEGPRATPTVADGRVFTFGAQGVLQAVDLESGERLWQINTHSRFGVRKNYFGAAASPIVIDGRVLVNIGGIDTKSDESGTTGAGIVAFNAVSGDVTWTATDHGASYSAPVVTSLRGRRVVLFYTREGLVELDPETGEIFAWFRWRPRSNTSINAASPIVIGNRVFLSEAYGTGAVLLDRGDTGFSPLWSGNDILSNHYATSLHHDGTLYGFDGALHLGPPALRAVDLVSGDVAWSQERYGGGAVLLVGDKLLVVRDNGELVVAEARPDAFRSIARAAILSPTVRALSALAGGVLYARNNRELVAVDLRVRRP